MFSDVIHHMHLSILDIHYSMKKEAVVEAEVKKCHVDLDQPNP